LKIVGQGAALARVLAEARGLRMHHGLLLSGARGTGKSVAATEVAKALLCEAGDDRQACGTCAVCAKVESRNHPDVHVVSVPEDKQDISVDQVRELAVTLGRLPVEGRARVAILDPGDRLNEQAQNALLKTLEEPGRDTFLLVVTSRSEGLLATVRSRMHQVRLIPLSRDQVETALAEQGTGNPGTRGLAAALSGGSVGLAEELVEEGVGRLHQHLVDFTSRPNDISPIACARDLLDGTADRKASQRRVRLVLGLLRGMLRETLHASLAPPEARPYFPDAFTSWAVVFHNLFEAEEDLGLQIAPEQVLTQALFRLQESLPRSGAVEDCPQPGSAHA